VLPIGAILQAPNPVNEVLEDLNLQKATPPRVSLCQAAWPIRKHDPTVQY
jgi:hypothetical protein